MPGKITLKKSPFTRKFFHSMERYYKNVQGGPAYIEEKRLRWRELPQVILYSTRVETETIGWIVYDPSRSTIEEIVVNSAFRGRDPKRRMLDTLISAEHLVAAEVLDQDRKKFDFLVRYGFRPTRRFLSGETGLIKMDLSTAVFLDKFRGAKPTVQYRKKELVAIEQVGDPRAYDEIKRGLENLINNLGGLKKFVKPGQTVLIKPNIVSDHGLKDGKITGGIVTDKRVIQALVELLLPLTGTIIIGEGSSINRSETVKLFEHYGYGDIVALNPDKVSLVDLNADELVEKPVPRGKRMLNRKIPLSVETADVIISVPVLKIHFAAIVSLSIKNFQGAVPPLEKYMTHFFGLWQNLVNIHHLIEPDLIIIDGLTGLEDFGPVSGTPKEMNLLLGGTNAVSVDATAMRIMGLDPRSSPPVFIAYLEGLGPLEKKNIEIAGTGIEKVARPFKQPEIDVSGGKSIAIHASSACSGCRGYLHFVLSKLRKPDPLDHRRLLIDRPLEKKVNIFLGPLTGARINTEEANIFMGICQQHNMDKGMHMPGCPPHAEVILNSLFSLFPDVERPKYADETEETKLGRMLEEILKMNY